MFSREDDDNDFYTESEVTPEVSKERKPDLHPDDPDYWEREESQWEHLRPGGKSPLIWWLAGALLAAVVLVLVYFHWFSPNVSEAVQFGYVERIERRGTVFKTYEGTLIPYKEIMDTTRLYTRDFEFTASDVKVAAELRRFQLMGKPVRVGYKQFGGKLPWRGETRTLVVSVDSVDERTILPPEYRPEYLKK